MLSGWCITHTHTRTHTPHTHTHHTHTHTHPHTHTQLVVHVTCSNSIHRFAYGGRKILFNILLSIYVCQCLFTISTSGLNIKCGSKRLHSSDFVNIILTVRIFLMTHSNGCAERFGRFLDGISQAFSKTYCDLWVAINRHSGPSSEPLMGLEFIIDFINSSRS